MKASVVIEDFGGVQAASGKTEIVNLLDAAEDEIFGREEIHAEIPNYTASSLNQYLQDLARDGKIGKIRYKKRIYFGCLETIKKIKAKGEEKIKAKTGELNAKKK